MAIPPRIIKEFANVNTIFLFGLEKVKVYEPNENGKDSITIISNTVVPESKHFIFDRIFFLFFHWLNVDQYLTRFKMRFSKLRTLDVGNFIRKLHTKKESMVGYLLAIHAICPMDQSSKGWSNMFSLMGWPTIRYAILADWQLGKSWAYDAVRQHQFSQACENLSLTSLDWVLLDWRSAIWSSDLSSDPFASVATLVIQMVFCI